MSNTISSKGNLLSSRNVYVGLCLIRMQVMLINFQRVMHESYSWVNISLPKIHECRSYAIKIISIHLNIFSPQNCVHTSNIYWTIAKWNYFFPCMNCTLFISLYIIYKMRICHMESYKAIRRCPQNKYE